MLVETHEVAVPIPVGLLDIAVGQAPADDNQLRQMEFARAAIWSACRREALDWLTANGLEASIDCFTSVGAQECRWGARFTVVVGRGAASATRPIGHDSPSFEAPVVDNWCWSDRWRDWLRTFTALTTDGEAVRRAHESGVADGSVIDMSARAGSMLAKALGRLGDISQ